MSDAPSSKVESDRQMLSDAQAQGGGAVWKTYVKLSGPGWLQSAITLGGGSLAGALFLGILGGTSMLWLQLMAIIMGVVMLSAISYVTLSTGERPFTAINKHINPVLGWGWLVATCMANMIWCMPQFSLCYEALEKNLAPGRVGDSVNTKLSISAVILVAVSIAVILNSRRGLAAKVFDWFLKALVGMIVICFFGVTIYLSLKKNLNWGEVLAGFVPDPSQWTKPTGKVAELIAGLSQANQDFWTPRVITAQRAVMIGAAATAVGINMTFLMPYAMLQRGWDKTFRGLARFDLATGMAIPYVLVTTCVVIAASTAFHANPAADPDFMSSDITKFYGSKTFGGAKDMLLARVDPNAKVKKFDHVFMDKVDDKFVDRSDGELLALLPSETTAKSLGDVASEVAAKSLVKDLDDETKYKADVKDKQFSEGIKDLKEKERTALLKRVAGVPLVAKMAALPEGEKLIASSMVKRNAFALSASLAPLLGEDVAAYVFGIGAFAMGFSTIIILMLINGFVFCEAAGKPKGGSLFVVGCLVAGGAGAIWPLVWDGPAKLWLAILTSSFGMMLLPIAYITFFMMMNSKRLMGDNKPQGGSMVAWNVLMSISVVGALVAASGAIMEKASHPTAGPLVIGVGVVYLVLVALGFVYMAKKKAA